MKLWAMLCRAIQDGWVMVERSDRMWFTGEGNGKLLQYSCLEIPMNSMKRQKHMTPEDEPPRLVGVQAYWGRAEKQFQKEWRGWPKRKCCSAVDVSGGESKVQSCKEQYYIGTWNVRSVNQGKLEVVKQEMARVNIDILAISELKWMGMCKFNLDDHIITL